jgi:hypothetical protein
MQAARCRGMSDRPPPRPRRSLLAILGYLFAIAVTLVVAYLMLRTGQQ